MRYFWDNLDEGAQTAIGLIIFILIVLLAGWFGEKMHNPNTYYGGRGSYLEEACPDCGQL